MDAIATRSWRWFITRVGGLSVKSRWVLWAFDDDRVIDDPIVAERAVMQFLG